MSLHPVSDETINKYTSKVVHSMKRDSLILALMGRYNLKSPSVLRGLSNNELATKYFRMLTKVERTRLFVNYMRMKGEEIPYWVYWV